jgi:hypothetical protein
MQVLARGHKVVNNSSNVLVIPGEETGRSRIEEVPFVAVGTRVCYISRRPGFRRENWPAGARMEPGVLGTVTEYYSQLQQMPQWAVVTWDHGGLTSIYAAGEGDVWLRTNNG